MNYPQLPVIVDIAKNALPNSIDAETGEIQRRANSSAP
jgi:hypothetical protein